MNSKKPNISKNAPPNHQPPVFFLAHESPQPHPSNQPVVHAGIAIIVCLVLSSLVIGSHRAIFRPQNQKATAAFPGQVAGKCTLVATPRAVPGWEGPGRSFSAETLRIACGNPCLESALPLASRSEQRSTFRFKGSLMVLDDRRFIVF